MKVLRERAFKVLTPRRVSNTGNKELRIQADRKMIITAVNLSDIGVNVGAGGLKTPTATDLVAGGLYEIILPFYRLRYIAASCHCEKYFITF